MRAELITIGDEILIGQIVNTNAVFLAKALNKIGSLYYTEEDYDDFYYGKGSTYPDVNGSIGILFEQASSRGHAQETANGLLTFSFTIRNQFTAALSTLEATHELKKDLLDYQRDFYKSARAEGNKSRDKAIVFGNQKDASTSYRLAEVLLRHDIKVHRLNKNLQKNGKQFPQENSFIVPLTQKKQRLVQAIFNEQTQFQDSLFYDVSAWTLPLAYGVESYQLKQGPDSYIGNELPLVELDGGSVMGGKAQSAYLMKWNRYYNARALYKILGSRYKFDFEMLKPSLNFWVFAIGSEHQGVFGDNLERLHEVFDMIPVIPNLNNTIDLVPSVFHTTDPEHINIQFFAAPTIK